MDLAEKIKEYIGGCDLANEHKDIGSENHTFAYKASHFGRIIARAGFDINLLYAAQGLAQGNIEQAGTAAKIAGLYFLADCIIKIDRHIRPYYYSR